MLNLKSMATPKEIKVIATMTDEERADLTARINSTDPFTIFDSVEGKEGKEIICPFCGNGSGKNRTGIKPNLENGVWLYNCFKCNEFSGNLLKIIATANNLDTHGKDFFEALAIAANILGLNISSPADALPKKNILERKNVKTTKQPAEEFKQLAEAKKNLPSFVEEQGGKWRGLSLETLQKFNCGFLPEIYFPEAKKGLPAVVIPNDLNGVYFRATEGKFHKNQSPTATTTIYIPNSNEFDLIVTEGQINAASIFQSFLDVTGVLPNLAIIASGGTSGNNNVLDKLQHLRDEGKKIRVLIAYDNDTSNAGQKAADKLSKTLKKAGYTAYITNFIKTPDIDFNDVLNRPSGNSELFNLIQENLAQIEPDSDADNFDINEVTETDINGETDTFQIEKNRVMDDQFEDAETEKFDILLPYVITNHGIKKIGKKEISLICPRAILIKEKFFNLEDKTFKLTLEHLNANKQWKVIPPQERGTILNKNKIVDCINYGLPIETGNAAKVVSWLSTLELTNEKNIPLTYTVNRCGWYNYKDTDYFIDPRITNTVNDDGKDIQIKVDSDNQMAKDLTTAGTLEKWKEAYLLARKSTVARFNVAAALASALLKPLRERNFVCYTYGKTRSGKSTSLYLAASAVGNNGLVRVFDATTNGLTAAAMNTNHFSFFVDEKQSADAKLRSNYQNWIYNDANGTERTRADKNGNPRPVRTWTHITICNGETMLLEDNATGGAFTRILQIAAPDEILDADTSKKIREIISENYGHALPLFIRQLFKENFEELRKRYQKLQSIMHDYCEDNNIEILPDYVRYIALVYIADQILNEALGLNKVSDNNKDKDNKDKDNNEDDGEGLKYTEIFEMLPTIDETEDSNRAENIVNTFIAMKAAHFDGDKNRVAALDCYGRYKDDFLYIIAGALNDYLIEKGFTPSKVARDLIDSGYFIPADKITESNSKTPRFTVVVKINGKNQRCYKTKKNVEN